MAHRSVALVAYGLLIVGASAQRQREQLPYWTDEPAPDQSAPIASLIAHGVGRLHNEASTWVARVGSRVYHTPPRGSSLSRDIHNYYVAIGSKSAMTDEMKERYVGGDGRWHIFHLPDGPSMLEVDSHKDRRGSFSALVQLTNGAQLSDTFPDYELTASTYTNPLDADGQAKEKAAVQSITKSSVRQKLDSLLEGSSSSTTRSWTNPQAQSRAQHFLLEEFKKMGLATCAQKFQLSGGEQTNIIGFMAGSKPDKGSVTIGAHYDSRPYDGPAPGADDNGSGVASLLSVAEKFTKSNFFPTTSVFFVAFAAEEPGLKGSEAFAQELLSNGGKNLPRECQHPKANSFIRSQGHWKPSASDHKAIILDEVGWKSPNMAKPTVNLESMDFTGLTVMDHLAQASHDYNGDKINIVHSNNPFGSDHMSWLDNSAPAVLLINGDDEAYPNYHSSSDTVDNVDKELHTAITRMAAGGLFRLSR